MSRAEGKGGCEWERSRNSSIAIRVFERNTLFSRSRKQFYYVVFLPLLCWTNYIFFELLEFVIPFRDHGRFSVFNVYCFDNKLIFIARRRSIWCLSRETVRFPSVNNFSKFFFLEGGKKNPRCWNFSFITTHHLYLSTYADETLSFRLIELDRSHRSPSLSDRPCSRSKRNAAICPRSIGGYNHKRLHPLPSRFRVYPEKHNQYLFICQLFPTNFPVNTPPSSKYKLKIRYIAQRPTPRDCNY